MSEMSYMNAAGQRLGDVAVLCDIRRRSGGQHGRLISNDRRLCHLLDRLRSVRKLKLSLTTSAV